MVNRALPKGLTLDALIKKTSELAIAASYLTQAISAYPKNSDSAQRQAKTAYTHARSGALTEQQEKALKADTSSGGRQRYQNYKNASDGFSTAKADWERVSKKQ